MGNYKRSKLKGNSTGKQMGAIEGEQIANSPRNTTSRAYDNAEYDALQELINHWPALTSIQQSKVMDMIEGFLKP